MKNDKTELQKYFESQGITQSMISERVGTKVAYVNDLVRRRKRFGRKTAARWSAEFGLSEAWLMTGEGEMLSKKGTTIIADNHSNAAGGNLHVGASEGTSDDIRSAINDLRELVSDCKDMVASCATLINTAQKTMESSVNLNNGMARNNDTVMSTFIGMSKMQQEHISEMRKNADDRESWVTSQMQGIIGLRSDIGTITKNLIMLVPAIKNMIDDQTKTTEAFTLNSLKLLEDACKTTDVSPIMEYLIQIVTTMRYDKRLSKQPEIDVAEK